MSEHFLMTLTRNGKAVCAFARRGTRGCAQKLVSGYRVFLCDDRLVCSMLGTLAHEALHIAEWVCASEKRKELRAWIVAEIVRVAASCLFSGRTIEEIQE